MIRKTRSNDRLELFWYVFEVWNQYLQDGYVLGSCMQVDEQAVSYIQRMLLILDYKFDFTVFKFLLKCLIVFTNVFHNCSLNCFI